MKTTSLETSKAIYAAFPEWGDTDFWWISQAPNEYHAPQDNYPIVVAHKDALGEYPYFDKKICPAYTLDYLLGKLPDYVTVYRSNGKWWSWDIREKHPLAWNSIDSMTSVECAGLLILKLKEEGVL